MFRRRTRTFVVLATLAIVATGCGSGTENADDTISPFAPASTLGGVGEVPAVPSAVREPVVVVRPPVNVDGTEAQLIGEIADGNRILMIGDSILASTSSRYGNHMCNAVVPLGWRVAVEAEPSRFVDFGRRVLDTELSDDPDPQDDWNAAVVFLGSNYGSDAIKYEIILASILDRLAPRPTLLFTVTEYRPNYVEVNEVVNRLGAERDNVTVLDWKTISETPGILSGDRLHPTDAGRRVLAESVAAALGPFPGGVGECLRSTFRDDSAVGRDSTKVLGRPSTGSDSGSATTTTTTATTTTTTRPPTSVTTTTVASGGGVGVSTTTLPASSSTTTVVPTTSSNTPAPPTTTSPPATTVASPTATTTTTTP